MKLTYYHGTDWDAPIGAMVTSAADRGVAADRAEWNPDGYDAAAVYVTDDIVHAAGYGDNIYDVEVDGGEVEVDGYGIEVLVRGGAVRVVDVIRHADIF